MFWKSHNPIGAARSSQYKSAIWFANEAQREAIASSVIQLEQHYQRDLTTEILPLTTFFNAEDYHQKYVLQRHDAVMQQLKLAYPDFNGLVDSTAAARLNGFAYGAGPKNLFEAEKLEYGVDEDLLAPLMKR